MTSGGDEEWSWPTEPARSPYYVTTKVVTGEAPAPKPQPVRLPTRSTATAEGPGTIIIQSYSWCDDGPAVKVYVSLPMPVQRDSVSCVIKDDSVELRVESADELAPRHELHLQKLFDHIDASRSSHKVIEHKAKIVVTLAKRGTHTDDTVSFKTWPRLHFGASSAGAERVQLAQFSSRASAEASMMPKLPQSSSRR